MQQQHCIALFVMHLYTAHYHMRAKAVPVRANLAYRDTLPRSVADRARNVLAVLLDVGK